MKSIGLRQLSKELLSACLNLCISDAMLEKGPSAQKIMFMFAYCRLRSLKYGAEFFKKGLERRP